MSDGQSEACEANKMTQVYVEPNKSYFMRNGWKVNATVTKLDGYVVQGSHDLQLSACSLQDCNRPINWLRNGMCIDRTTPEYDIVSEYVMAEKSWRPFRSDELPDLVGGVVRIGKRHLVIIGCDERSVYTYFEDTTPEELLSKYELLNDENRWTKCGVFE